MPNVRRLASACRSSTSRAIIVPAMGCALVLLAAAGGGYALASGGGKIKACVHHQGGGLYLGHCARGDKRLTWNKLGRQGPPGKPAVQGPPGPFPITLPAGKTITGTYAAEGGAGTNTGSDIAGDGISWPYRLSSPPAVHFILLGQPVPAGCFGSFAAPGAESGNLCIFEADHSGVTAVGACNVQGTACTNTVGGIGSDPSLEIGVWVHAFGPTTQRWGDEGTWAVTG